MSPAGSVYPGIKVDPLDFEFVSEDDQRATCQAIVSGNSAVGQALFALTVITATPGNSDEEADLQESLDQLRAGFR